MKTSTYQILGIMTISHPDDWTEQQEKDFLKDLIRMTENRTVGVHGKFGKEINVHRPSIKILKDE